MKLQRIALVEDNADNRLVARAILEDLYDVEEYATGAEALEGLTHDAHALVLLDISLPAMDGIEVLRRLREHPRLRNLPVIALTAHAMSGDREKFLRLGFDAYVTKPIVDEQLLLDAIARLIPPR